MKLLRSRKQKKQALTLVEVLVAVIIAAFTSLGFMASLIIVMRANAENRLHYYAVQQVAYYQNLAAASDYDKLGVTTDSDDLEYIFRRSASNPLIVDIKEGAGGQKTSVKLWFEFSGWGTVSSVSSSSIGVTLPSGQSGWTTNRWKDRYVSVNRYAGDKTTVSNFGRIVSNSSNGFSYTADLSGSTSTEFSPAPAVGDRIVIDNGKTLTIHAEWGDGQKYRNISRSYLIQQRLD